MVYTCFSTCTYQRGFAVWTLMLIAYGGQFFVVTLKMSIASFVTCMASSQDAMVFVVIYLTKQGTKIGLGSVERPC